MAILIIRVHVDEDPRTADPDEVADNIIETANEVRSANGESRYAFSSAEWE